MSNHKKRRRHTPEQITARLREADALRNAGQSVTRIT